MEIIEKIDISVLENDHWRIGVLPDVGGSLAFGQIRHGDDWVDYLRPTPEDALRQFTECASYVLIPWSNRLRDATFTYRGDSYTLRVNAKDGTAIHGAANEFPWRVTANGSSRSLLSFDSGRYHGVNYPWRFSAEVEYALDERRFTTTTWVRNNDTVPVPVGFGHHPYFQRALTGPEDEVLLEIPCSEQFVLVDAMPDGPPVPVQPRVDFRQLRPLGSVFIDDCLTGRQADQPIRFRYPASGVGIDLAADPVFANVVLYVPQDGTDYFAVEPVTNANDGFNLHERGVPGSGVVVLEPGEELTGTFWFELTAGA